MNCKRTELVQLLAISVVMTLIFLFVNANPINGDSLLAWPIAESVNHSWYSGGDLIIEAAKNTNFLLYKILAHFPWYQDNLPLRDTIIFTPIICIYGFLWALFFYKISKSFKVSVLTLAIFLFSDNKLGLHWSYSPLPFLISYTSIHFLQIAALILFYIKRYKVSFFLLALTSFLHPATALSYFVTFAGIALFREKNIKQLFLYSLAFLIPFGINFVLFLGGNKTGSLGEEHFKIYELFQNHVYVQDHFHEGYLYFAGCLGLIFSLRRFYTSEFLKFSFLFYSISIFFSLLWLINAYFIKNTQFLYFYYIMRIFYLLKPLTLFAITWGLFNYFERLDIKALNNWRKAFTFLVVFLFVKCLFRYSSFDSALMVLSLIALVGNRLKMSMTFVALFILSNAIKFETFLKLSTSGYLSLPLLVVILWMINKKRPA